MENEKKVQEEEVIIDEDELASEGYMEESELDDEESDAIFSDLEDDLDLEDLEDEDFEE